MLATMPTEGLSWDAFLERTAIPPRVLTDEVAFLHAVREGVAGQVITDAIELFGGDRGLFVRLLETTPGNLHRYYKKAILNRAQSEEVLDLLRLFMYASSIFDSDDIVREWFFSEIPALSGSRPVDIMDTFQGRAMVRDVLGKIEFGEFS